MMRMIVNGTPFEDFTDAHCSKSLENMAGDFSFSATWDVGDPFPIPRSAHVQILIGDDIIVDGYVERIEPRISPADASISISGRDKTSDIVDSTLPASAVQVIAGITLEAVVRKVIAAIGSTVGVINNAPDITPFGEADVISNEAGENAFEFLERLARKKQVLLTTDGAGNVIITRGGTAKINYKLQNLLDDPENTITSSAASIDDSERFRTYAVVSQSNLTGMTLSGGAFNPDSASNTAGTVVTDSDIRAGRTMYIMAEESMDAAYCTTRAQWEANIRKARSRSYSCAIVGYHDFSGNLIRPNTLVDVSDYSVNVFETMLIKAINYQFSLSEGMVSHLDLVHKDSYTLQLNEPQSQKNAEKFW